MSGCGLGLNDNPTVSDGNSLSSTYGPRSTPLVDEDHQTIGKPYAMAPEVVGIGLRIPAKERNPEYARRRCAPFGNGC